MESAILIIEFGLAAGIFYLGWKLKTQSTLINDMKSHLDYAKGLSDWSKEFYDPEVIKNVMMLRTEAIETKHKHFHRKAIEDVDKLEGEKGRLTELALKFKKIAEEALENWEDDERQLDRAILCLVYLQQIKDDSLKKIRFFLRDKEVGSKLESRIKNTIKEIEERAKEIRGDK